MSWAAASHLELCILGQQGLQGGRDGLNLGWVVLELLHGNLCLLQLQGCRARRGRGRGAMSERLCHSDLVARHQEKARAGSREGALSQQQRRPTCASMPSRSLGSSRSRPLPLLT